MGISGLGLVTEDCRSCRGDFAALEHRLQAMRVRRKRHNRTYRAAHLADLRAKQRDYARGRRRRRTTTVPH
jgi:hypothetical protein